MSATLTPERAAAGDRARTQLALEGMTCASCATRIEKRLNRLEGVTATVNYAAEAATVDFDPALVTPADLVAAVEASGYGASVAGEERRERDDRIGLRLGVALALAVPVADDLVGDRNVAATCVAHIGEPHGAKSPRRRCLAPAASTSAISSRGRFESCSSEVSAGVAGRYAAGT